MDGVLILNTTTVSDTASWVFIASLLLGMIVVIAFYFMVVSMSEKASLGCGITSLVALILTIGLILLGKTHWRENERNQYECVIDNDVSIVEVYENYNVVECRGEIWILEDKVNE